MKEEKVLDNQVIQILMLGPGGSGKSTVVKQIRKIHRDPKEEKEFFDAPACLMGIHKMLCYDILDLCTYNMRERDKNKSLEIEDDKCRRLVDLIAKDGITYFNHMIIRKPLAERIAYIWSCQGIQNTFKLRRKQHIMDNTPYFLEKIFDLCVTGESENELIPTIHIKDMNYIPTWDDYLRIREQTTGVSTYHVVSKVHNKEWHFRLTDVGGQRSERKKWLNIFDQVQVVIYVMALNGYDQYIYEATTVRCYDESFRVFRELAQNEVFQHTDFILFLNKLDLFQEKVQHVPFTVYDPQFEENSKHDRDKVLHYVEQQFENIWYKECQEQWHRQRALFFHLTCSLDTQMMQAIIANVNLALIKKAMHNAAMI